MWYGIPWSFLVVGDEGYLVPSRKLLCLCQPPENYAPNGMALFHTCLTVGLIQLFISFYYLKISMGIHLLVAHHLHPLSQIFCSKWMKERIIEKKWFLSRISSKSQWLENLTAKKLFKQLLLLLLLLPSCKFQFWSNNQQGERWKVAKKVVIFRTLRHKQILGHQH